MKVNKYMDAAKTTFYEMVSDISYAQLNALSSFGHVNLLAFFNWAMRASQVNPETSKSNAFVAI